MGITLQCRQDYLAAVFGLDGILFSFSLPPFDLLQEQLYCGILLENVGRAINPPFFEDGRKRCLGEKNTSTAVKILESCGPFLPVSV